MATEKIEMLPDDREKIDNTDTEQQDEYSALLTEYEQLSKKYNSAVEEIDDLRQQLANLKKVVFGQRSEKAEVVLEGAEQLTLFNEAEENCDPKEIRETTTVSAHQRNKKRTHKETFENLPVEEIVHEVADKTCPVCGKEMKTVGKEFVRDELVYVPAKLFVRKHFVEAVKCPSCGKDDSSDDQYDDIAKQQFKKAEAPKVVIPGSYCSPELLAHIIYEKYVQAVPLYRQEKDFKALGAEISRQTMSNWIVYSARTYFQPIYDVMKAELLTKGVIHADETVVQVLHEKDRKAKTQSRMWVYCSDKSAGKLISLYEYSPTRNGSNAVEFLGDYGGYLVCDGYDGYNKIKTAKRCGCWAHYPRSIIIRGKTKKVSYHADFKFVS